jgi:hypothetical protein
VNARGGKVHATTPIERKLSNYSREDWPLCGIAPWQGAMTRKREDVTCKTCLRLLAAADERSGA